MIDKAKLAEWREKTEAATELPWEHLPLPLKRTFCSKRSGLVHIQVEGATEADKKFIEAASEAMPALLAEVERLQEYSRMCCGSCEHGDDKCKGPR